MHYISSVFQVLSIFLVFRNACAGVSRRDISDTGPPPGPKPSLSCVLFPGDGLCHFKCRLFGQGAEGYCEDKTCICKHKDTIYVEGENGFEPRSAPPVSKRSDVGLEIENPNLRRSFHPPNNRLNEFTPEENKLRLKLITLMVFLTKNGQNVCQFLKDNKIDIDAVKRLSEKEHRLNDVHSRSIHSRDVPTESETISNQSRNIGTMVYNLIPQSCTKKFAPHDKKSKGKEIKQGRNNFSKKTNDNKVPKSNGHSDSSFEDEDDDDDDDEDNEAGMNLRSKSLSLYPEYDSHGKMTPKSVPSILTKQNPNARQFTLSVDHSPPHSLRVLSPQHKNRNVSDKSEPVRIKRVPEKAGRYSFTYPLKRRKHSITHTHPAKTKLSQFTPLPEYTVQPAMAEIIPPEPKRTLIINDHKITSSPKRTPSISTGKSRKDTTLKTPLRKSKPVPAHQKPKASPSKPAPVKVKNGGDRNSPKNKMQKLIGMNNFTKKQPNVRPSKVNGAEILGSAPNDDKSKLESTIGDHTDQPAAQSQLNEKVKPQTLVSVMPVKETVDTAQTAVKPKEQENTNLETLDNKKSAEEKQESAQKPANNENDYQNQTGDSQQTTNAENKGATETAIPAVEDKTSPKELMGPTQENQTKTPVLTNDTIDDYKEPETNQESDQVTPDVKDTKGSEVPKDGEMIPADVRKSSSDENITSDTNTPENPSNSLPDSDTVPENLPEKLLELDQTSQNADSDKDENIHPQNNEEHKDQGEKDDKIPEAPEDDIKPEMDHNRPEPGNDENTHSQNNEQHKDQEGKNNKMPEAFEGDVEPEMDHIKPDPGNDKNIHLQNNEEHEDQEEEKDNRAEALENEISKPETDHIKSEPKSEFEMVPKTPATAKVEPTSETKTEDENAANLKSAEPAMGNEPENTQEQINESDPELSSDLESEAHSVLQSPITAELELKPETQVEPERQMEKMEEPDALNEQEPKTQEKLEPQKEEGTSPELRAALEPQAEPKQQESESYTKDAIIPMQQHEEQINKAWQDPEVESIPETNLAEPRVQPSDAESKLPSTHQPEIKTEIQSEPALSLEPLTESQHESDTKQPEHNESDQTPAQSNILEEQIVPQKDLVTEPIVSGEPDQSNRQVENAQETVINGELTYQGLENEKKSQNSGQHEEANATPNNAVNKPGITENNHEGDPTCEKDSLLDHGTVHEPETSMNDRQSDPLKENAAQTPEEQKPLKEHYDSNPEIKSDSSETSEPSEKKAKADAESSNEDHSAHESESVTKPEYEHEQVLDEFEDDGHLNPESKSASVSNQPSVSLANKGKAADNSKSDTGTLEVSEPSKIVNVEKQSAVQEPEHVSIPEEEHEQVLDEFEDHDRSNPGAESKSPTETNQPSKNPDIQGKVVDNSIPDTGISPVPEPSKNIHTEKQSEQLGPHEPLEPQTAGNNVMKDESKSDIPPKSENNAIPEPEKQEKLNPTEHEDETEQVLEEYEDDDNNPHPVTATKSLSESNELNFKPKHTEMELKNSEPEAENAQEYKLPNNSNVSEQPGPHGPLEPLTVGNSVMVDEPKSDSTPTSVNNTTPEPEKQDKLNPMEHEDETEQVLEEYEDDDNNPHPVTAPKSLSESNELNVKPEHAEMELKNSKPEAENAQEYKLSNNADVSEQPGLHDPLEPVENSVKVDEPKSDGTPTSENNTTPEPEKQEKLNPTEHEDESEQVLEEYEDDDNNPHLVTAPKSLSKSDELDLNPEHVEKELENSKPGVENSKESKLSNDSDKSKEPKEPEQRNDENSVLKGPVSKNNPQPDEIPTPKKSTVSETETAEKEDLAKSDVLESANEVGAVQPNASNKPKDERDKNEEALPRYPDSSLLDNHSQSQEPTTSSEEKEPVKSELQSGPNSSLTSNSESHEVPKRDKPTQGNGALKESDGNKGTPENRTNDAEQAPPEHEGSEIPEQDDTEQVLEEYDEDEDLDNPERFHGREIPDFAPKPIKPSVPMEPQDQNVSTATPHDNNPVAAQHLRATPIEKDLKSNSPKSPENYSIPGQEPAESAQEKLPDPDEETVLDEFTDDQDENEAEDTPNPDSRDADIKILKDYIMDEKY